MAARSRGIWKTILLLLLWYYVEKPWICYTENNSVTTYVNSLHVHGGCASHLIPLFHLAFLLLLRILR